MLFPTPAFLFFLIAIFAIHWWVIRQNVRWQNVLLLAASYFFYACWDWRFLGLLLFSTLVDYFSGILIAGSERDGYRKFWLITSVLINLAFLSAFKYYDFFAKSFASMMGSIGITVDVVLLELILPVGISFYTFHGLSYVIDIYYRRIGADRQWVDYALFVSYFPLLVAGPIERANHLLPQLKKKRDFNYASAVIGLRMILWGLFKKVVIADSCAEYVDHVYANPELFGGSTLLFVAILFSFQIYGDFSGYSDIATGVSKLFGIDLLRNFKTPYFARSITEFWKRWHISLSSWFRDYLFKPIGGSRVNNFITSRNLLVVFLVSGLWHGANITFIIWGALHATFVITERFINHGKLANSITPDSEQLNLSDVIRMAWVFGVVTILWIFFRAAHITDALSFLAGMCNWSLFSLPSSAVFSTMTVHPAILLLLIAAFTVVEWQDRNRPYTLAFLDDLRSRASRFVVYYIILSLVFVVPSKPENFIYFQF